MSLSTDIIKDHHKLPLLLRQGVRLRRASSGMVQVQRNERLPHWQQRLEKLFARQAY
jgi:hypothetical protein